MLAWLNSRSAARIAAIYLATALTYILLSDRVVEWLAPDAATAAHWQSVKGIAYVLVTGLMFYVLIAHEQRGKNQASERLDHVIGVSPALIYRLRVRDADHSDFTVDFVSDTSRQIIGYTPDQWNDPGFWMRHVHPDDVTQAQQNQRKLFETGELRHHYRFRHADGSYRWIEDQLLLYRDAGGRPLEIVGSWLDVTATYEAERQLRLHAMVFESSRDGFMVTDREHRMVAVNSAFETITGYSRDEALGHTPALLRSGRQPEAFYREIWQTLGRDGYWQGEVWNRRKNGEIYPQWLRISAVNNPSGAVENYVAVMSDLSQHKKAEQTIYNLAYYDVLTNLPNRRLLLDRLSQLLLSPERDTWRALLLVDLDNFKALNDTHGYNAGDQVLLECAQRLRASLHPDDTLARLGSDEFVVVIDALHGTKARAVRNAEAIGERIRERLRAPFTVGGGDYFCSVSIGVGLFQSDGSDADTLLMHADAAMHRAKASGRDRLQFYDPDIQAALQERVLLETSLHQAIPDQLRLVYQAQVDAKGRLFGAEVLVRWQHPQRGLVSPAAFIPLAEESGLILPIGRWVLEAACRQLKVWESHPRASTLQLAVNVSAREFQQTDFVNAVLDVLARTGARPQRLKLELTESMLADNVPQLIEKMGTLKAHGVTFALDDFGTGFSSLAYLRQLPIDQLKIDQSFVRDLPASSNDVAIVRAMIALGNNLGLSVIAEGVETEAQRQFLAEQNCLNFQGYLIGRPMPIHDLERSWALGSS